MPEAGEVLQVDPVAVEDQRALAELLVAAGVGAEGVGAQRAPAAEDAA